MCVRKCVRKDISKSACEVRACGHFLWCDVRLHFSPWWQTILCIFTLDDMVVDHFMYYLSIQYVIHKMVCHHIIQSTFYTHSLVVNLICEL